MPSSFSCFPSSSSSAQASIFPTATNLSSHVRIWLTGQVGGWYVSNVSIIFECSMLFYYKSWMFYNHFIVILYHFLVLTYWHSASCYFFHVFYIAENQYQMESKCHETSRRFFMDQKTRNGPKQRLGGVLRGEHNPPGRARAPGRPLVGCPPPGAPPRGAALAH